MYNVSLAQYNQDNTKTDEHIQIPGTKYYIVPPSGFIEAEGFQGFQSNKTGASIVMIDVPRNFKDVLSLFDKDKLNKQNIRMKNEKFLSLNMKQAYLVTLEQTDKGKDFTKQVLLLDGGSSTYMLNGMYLKDLRELNTPMRNAFKTIVYDSKSLIDPYKGVNFRLNTDGTKLTLAKSIAGTLMYSTDGYIPPKVDDNTIFIAGSSLLSEGDDKKEVFFKKLAELPYKDLEYDESKVEEVVIDGLNGYALSVKGIHKASKGKKPPKELIYQVMLFTDYTYYQMVGSTREDFFKNQLLFEKIAQTFKKL